MPKVPVERLPYFAEQAMEHLSGFEQPSPTGILTPLAIAQSLSQHMPEKAIVSDEAMVIQEMP